MTTRFWVLLLLLAFLLCGSPLQASTENIRPLETLQGPINRIIQLLNDPAYTGPEKRALQRDKIWEIARPVFDFDEISRRAVGKSWENFSAEEKSRFTAIFTEFLGNTYIDKLQGEYHNEKIAFDKELVKGNKALVRTRLQRETLEIPIDYRMQQIDGAWKIYDILVENGVSIVKNYYVQFNSMLQNSSPNQLIEKLERKLNKQDTKLTP